MQRLGSVADGQRHRTRVDADGKLVSIGSTTSRGAGSHAGLRIPCSLTICVNAPYPESHVIVNSECPHTQCWAWAG